MLDLNQSDDTFIELTKTIIEAPDFTCEYVAPYTSITAQGEIISSVWVVGYSHNKFFRLAVWHDGTIEGFSRPYSSMFDYNIIKVYDKIKELGFLKPVTARNE